jgi:hypothetical protein
MPLIPLSIVVPLQVMHDALHRECRQLPGVAEVLLWENELFPGENAPLPGVDRFPGSGCIPFRVMIHFPLWEYDALGGRSDAPGAR